MPVRSHFNLFNKDSRDLFMLCIVFMCQLYRVLFIIVVQFHCCSLFCVLFDFSVHSFVQLLFSFESLLFIYSLFHCTKEKDSILILDSIPGISILLHVKYLSTIVPAVQEIPSLSIQVNKHHTSGCTDFVLV
jgi:hypothetical protein